MFHQGKEIKGSMINGYRIIRLKLFRPREQETAEKLRNMQAGVAIALKQVKALQKLIDQKNITPQERRSLTAQLDEKSFSYKKNKNVYDAILKKDVLKRTFYWASLIHRLVAEHFLPSPTPEQIIVIHTDHDKLNNKVNNLKWVTDEEKNSHQLTSPLVIAEKEKRKDSVTYHPANSKLSVTQVMYLKKLLNEGKPIRNLAKQFKITETQVTKIKKKESWASVEAAK